MNCNSFSYKPYYYNNPRRMTDLNYDIPVPTNEPVTQPQQKIDTPHVFIATPCYGGVVHKNYTLSLLEYVSYGIPYTVQFLDECSMITLGRNDLITQFYMDMDKNGYTHLLWQDADVHIPAQGLIKLLSHNVDVVAARVPIKAPVNPMKYSVRNIIGQVKPDLLKVEAAATGAFLMSKKAVKALIDNAKKNDDIYRMFYTANESYFREVYDVFKVGIREKEYMTEDWFICYKLQELGFDIHVDPTIIIDHTGSFTYHGQPYQTINKGDMK